MTKLLDLSAKVDALLPQTQCGLCEYSGCMPYAEAITSENERIDKCLPGGVEVLVKLGELLHQDPTPFISEMEKNQKSASRVVIREEACIGCTKCIQACPVDAIIGSAKLMHTVIADACTGCDLCIERCPVDCIDIVNIPARNEEEKNHMAEKSRARYDARNARLQRWKREDQTQHQAAKLISPETMTARKIAIQEAILRAKEKKKS